MATEKLEMDLKNLDRRIAARLVRRGLISEKELDKALKTLPDSAERAEKVESELNDDELDED